MKTLENPKIKTFLPVFNGFYNSIWEYDDENVFNNWNIEKIEE